MREICLQNILASLVLLLLICMDLNRMTNHTPLGAQPKQESILTDNAVKQYLLEVARASPNIFIQ